MRQPEGEAALPVSDHANVWLTLISMRNVISNVIKIHDRCFAMSGSFNGDLVRLPDAVKFVFFHVSVTIRQFYYVVFVFGSFHHCF